ncbi:hypothetical protein ACRQ5Q_16725 [Bradyrhizobium sp. PMVTL-01]|uniref:hypothetical protein n=1 Tax=Bradyrhizobium sp. PMVTL-01 TaxID=3434999 RepID=UPI003F70A3E6
MSEIDDVQKGDPRIIAELEHALWRNRNRDNLNLARGRMFFDFGVGKVRIASHANDEGEGA